MQRVSKLMHFGIVLMLVAMTGSLVVSASEIMTESPRNQPVCLHCNVFLQGCNSSCPLCPTGSGSGKVCFSN